MKHLLSTSLFILLIFTGLSQTQLPNGHWVNPFSISSPSLHLFFEGYSNGAYHYGITNKQPCTVQFSIVGAGKDTLVSILAGKNKHLKLVAPYNADTIFAKAITDCSATYDTCYWGITTIGALPIVFNSLSAKRVSDTEIRLTLNIAELNGADYYRCVISVDNGVTWIERLIFLPSNIVLNQNYSGTFKYK